MPLVEYSSSESDLNDTERTEGKDEVITERTDILLQDQLHQDLPASYANNTEAKPPPLPAAFHSLYATGVRTSLSDDPDLHGGRKRQTPHVQGNWPSHIFLDWFPENSTASALEDLIDQARHNFSPRFPQPASSTIHSSLRSDLDVQLPLHISLSAPLALAGGMKDDFLSSLRAVLERSQIHTFAVNPSGLAWFSNFEKSRHFLVLQLRQGKERELDQLLATCNKVCRDFDLTLLYDNSNAVGVGHHEPDPANDDHHEACDAFHVTIAWTLVEPSEQSKLHLQHIDVQNLAIAPIGFDVVKVKVGNMVTEINLKSYPSNQR